MRIGIDLQVLGQKQRTGVGNYAFHLVEALLKMSASHQFILFIPKLVIPATEPGSREWILNQVQDDKKIEIIELPPKKIPFWSAHVTYARIMRKAGLDILHGPANVLPWFYQPINGRATEPGSEPIYRHSKTVITVHDLAIYKHPEWFPRGQWFSTKFLVPRSIKKADAIIVPSQATKKDLQELFRVPEEKIRVISLGVGEEYFQVESGKLKVESHRIGTRKYILFVGTLEPRKNVGRLIEAYEGLPGEVKEEYDLVIAGMTPSYSPPIPIQVGTGGERRAGISPSRREGGDGEGVKFLGYIPDKDLPALYQNASLFVYPSLYEGFGLPVLEAMAAGVPVVTSKGTAMEEIDSSKVVIPASEPGSRKWIPGQARNDRECALLVDPYSIGQIGDAMKSILADQNLAHEMREKGIRIAREFTWDRTAQETLKVYEKLVS